MSTELLIPYGKFEKWTACGNDFILTSSEIPERKNDIEPEDDRLYITPKPPKRRAIQRVCDRHFGVGADGVIFINESDVADAKITIINANGTRAEMCGNGIRCVGQYVGRVLGKDKVSIETDAGIKELLLAGVDVHVDMGPVVIRWNKPMYLPGTGPDPTNPVKYYDSTFVDVGNPHCVLLVKDYEEWEIAHYGDVIEHMDNTFPGGTNVEFVEPLNHMKIRMRVWERGVGRTLACGTGAVASAYVAYKRGLVDNIVTVDLEGGEVEIRITDAPEGERFDKVVMVGMAERVFNGKFRKDVLTGEDPYPPEYIGDANPDPLVTPPPKPTFED